MKLRIIAPLIIVVFLSAQAYASRILIPMDAKGQTNHLKAYGIAFAAIRQGLSVDWLLNYKGGSFSMDENTEIELMCRQRGVTYSLVTGKQYAQIAKEIKNPAFNGAIVKLEKTPRIAVYTPPNKEPWDDAVTLALTYAEIPFDKIYADDVLTGALDKYDWLHLHHEDFTGQYGKFWMTFHNAPWYQADKQKMESIAAKNGYKKVSQMQLAVVKKIRDFVNGGGNLFAMCSATETFDIALAADGVDICDTAFDGDPIDNNAQQKLDFSKCFAFRDFSISTNPAEYRHSNIDNTFRLVPNEQDNFNIITPSAQLDLVPVMLCQNHSRRIRGFMGQTTAFRKEVIKPDVMILGDRVQANEKPDTRGHVLTGDYYMQDYEARYIHGEYGKGSWTFLSGHDPEAYQHRIGDPATNLSLYPNSPGYRLILNNVLFPAAKKTVVPTVVINNTEHQDVKTTGVGNTIPANKISIYPNPANNKLVISIGAGKIDQVIITNIAGQEVFNYTYNTDNATVDLQTFAAGMYLVKVNGEYIGKVVKN